MGFFWGGGIAEIIQAKIKIKENGHVKLNWKQNMFHECSEKSCGKKDNLISTIMERQILY